MSEQLDCRGLLCPEPVMMLHSKVNELASGSVLTVFATDPSTERDIPKFCQFLGHTLESVTQENAEYIYTIQIA